MHQIIMPPRPGNQVLFVQPGPEDDLILILKAISEAGYKAEPSFYNPSAENFIFALFIKLAKVDDPNSPPLAEDWEALATRFDEVGLDPNLVRAPWRGPVREVVAA